MTPHSFREALHALLSADRKLQMTLNGTLGTLGSVGRNNAWDAMLAAFAEVERLYAARVGEERPKRVRCVQVINPEYSTDRHFWAEAYEGQFPPHYQLTPGWFVPDGAE